LRQPSVEFKLGLLEFSSVLCDGSGSFLTKHSGAFMLKAMTQAHRHTQHGKCLAEEKLGLKGARSARIASGD